MIRKAIIPIAGLGSRLYPLTGAIPKALLPLVDACRQVRPILHYILSEAASCGATDVALIASPSHLELLRKYLDTAEEMNASPGVKVQIIEQPKPAGFGEAVLRGAGYIGEEPFLLLLGDHVHIPDSGRASCAAQVVQAFEEYGGAAMIGMQPVKESELPLVGAAAGEKISDNVYRCTKFVEKPDIDTARASLVTPGLPKGTYLAHCGIYAFSPEIFHILKNLAASDRPHGTEVQLAEAQGLLLAAHPQEYRLLRIAGRSLDTGTPETYAAALEAMRSV